MSDIIYRPLLMDTRLYRARYRSCTSIAPSVLEPPTCPSVYVGHVERVDSFRLLEASVGTRLEARRAAVGAPPESHDHRNQEKPPEHLGPFQSERRIGP